MILFAAIFCKFGLQFDFMFLIAKSKGLNIWKHKTTEDCSKGFIALKKELDYTKAYIYKHLKKY